MVTALIPPEKRTGFCPRLSPDIAERWGLHGDSRRAVQDDLLPVFSLPISQGGIQKVIGRVSQAVKPHYESIAKVARAAPVGHVDETSWRRQAELGIGGQRNRKTGVRVLRAVCCSARHALPATLRKPSGPTW